MIQLNNIKFHYASSDFSLRVKHLSIPEQSSASFIGPSGCGKTTLMSLVAGILPTQAGKINVNNIEIDQLDDKGRRQFRIHNIGFIFQDFALIDYLNCYDNILHPYRINSALDLNDEVKSRAKQLAKQLGIEKKLTAFPHRISQGEKQRVAICRALINQPAVILADEPMSNLDSDNKKIILDCLTNYIKENDATLIVATHDESLLNIFDQVIDIKELIHDSLD